MPYHVGKKGSYGCSGYPVVKDGTGDVMGCHDSEADAKKQIAAINISESKKVKKEIYMGSDKDPITGEEREAILEDNEPGFKWNGMFKPVMTKAKEPNYGQIIKPRRGEPANKELYARIISEAKRKFDVYPSAVANAWVVAEYKRRGGKYKRSSSK
jgi:hypothetical protein